MATQDKTTAPADAKPAEKKKEEPRPYFVTSKHTVDLSQDPATIIAALQALNPDESKLTIFAVVGEPKGLQPKLAIKELGKTRDLAGDFEVFAQNSVVSVPNVQIGTERVVRFG